MTKPVEYRAELREASREQLCEWILQLEHSDKVRFDLVMEHGATIQSLRQQLEAAQKENKLLLENLAESDNDLANTAAKLAQCEADARLANAVLDELCNSDPNVNAEIGAISIRLREAAIAAEGVGEEG